MAVDRGIKVITIDINVENPLITEIQQDDFALSFQICKQMVQDTNGNANLIYMSQPQLGFAPLVKRDKVWQSYKWQYKGLNEVAMIGQVNADVVKTAKVETHKVLKEFPNINTVIAMWDQFAHGAVEAIYEEGKNNDISVYSIDISDEVLAAMHKPDSSWKCTAGLDPWLLGNMSVQCAWSWLAGSDLGKYILLDPVLITQEYVLEQNIKTMKELVKSVPELKVEPFLKKYPFLRAPHHLPPPIKPNVEPIFPKFEPQVLPVSHQEHDEQPKKKSAMPPKRVVTQRPQSQKQPTKPSPLAQHLGIPFV